MLVVLSSCGGEDASSDPIDDDDSSTTPNAPILPGTPLPPDMTGGSPAPNSPSSPPVQSNEGNAPISGLNPAPAATPPASDTPSDGEEDPETPPASAAEPIIPQPNGECPEFRSGSQRIMGLDTEIVAGEPGATKGPLLFTWHGTGGSGRGAMLQLPQSVQRDIVARGGIVIAPSDNGQVRAGVDVTFVLGVWYDGADLDYADHIVGCAVQNHNIDPRQIYVTGCSAGGLMAGVMSLERSSYVAAAAPNSGGIALPVAIQDRTRHPAVFAMHGGTGDNVIVNFGDTSRQLLSTLAPLGSFLVECNHNSGHCGAPASLHENAWEFMLAHPFGTDPSPYANGLPGDFPNFCAIQ
jgi:predicted esterase